MILFVGLKARLRNSEVGISEGNQNRPTFMGIFIFSFHQYLPGLWPLLGQNLCNHDSLESELERFIRINVLLLHATHAVGDTWWE